MEDNNSALVSPLKKRARKRTSSVWNAFIKQPEDGKAVCRGCGKQYGQKTATTTLKKHLEGCSQAFTGEFNQEAAQRLLTQWLLANNIAPNALDCPFFTNLMGTLCPKFEPPHRTTFATVLTTEECDRLRKTIQEELEKISSYCISFDGWSSSALRGYLGVVLHGIDEDWKLQTFLLSLKHVSEGETAEYVAALIEEVGCIFG